MEELPKEYLKRSGAIFHTILKFWLRACSIDASKSILPPKDELVMRLRQEVIPNLVLLT